MRGFEISGAGRKLVPQFLTAELLREVLVKLNGEELMFFLRQWAAEGIPFAFRECPVVYEYLRSWMGDRLNVEPRNITVIGSARLGFSLCPQDFGRPFRGQSDLDFSVISDRLFANIVADFELWRSKVERREEKFNDKYGRENVSLLPTNIRSGFIDAYKIDTHRYLAQALLVTNTSDYGLQILQSTTGAPTVKRLAIRVYADFNAFFRQMRINLDHTLSRL